MLLNGLLLHNLIKDKVLLTLSKNWLLSLYVVYVNGCSSTKIQCIDLVPYEALDWINVCIFLSRTREWKLRYGACWLIDCSALATRRRHGEMRMGTSAIASLDPDRSHDRQTDLAPDRWVTFTRDTYFYLSLYFRNI